MDNRVKITTFERILDFIYPNYCKGCGKIGEGYCLRCIFDNISQNRPIFSSSEADFCWILACGKREGALSKLILEYKFHARRHLSRSLAQYLAAVTGGGRFLGNFSRSADELAEKYVLVPLPTIRKHVRERGFDHILRLTRDFSAISGLPMVQALSRRKSAVQVGSSAKQRLEQAKEAYTINSKAVLDKKCHYILVDDVWTTGATMRAARGVLAAELRRLGVSDIKISAIVLAKNSGSGFF